MNEEIDILIAKKLTGEASGEELHLLQSWIDAEKKNAEEYERIAGLWQKTDGLFDTVTFDTPAAWNKVATLTVNKGRTARRIELKDWMRYAAVAAVFIIGIFVVRTLLKPGMETVVAENGNKDVILPDKSHVTLRKGSKLSYPATFAINERNVKLEGEAFFEVTHNEAQPFVIDAQSVSVKVLGTSFDVRCNEESASVTVASGKVQVKSKNDTMQRVVLTKGEFGQLVDSKLTEGVVADANYLFWKTGLLRFESQPLSKIAERLAYYYQQKITFADNTAQEVKDQLVTISFNNQPLDGVLDELCLVTHCKWERKGAQYIISAK